MTESRNTFKPSVKVILFFVAFFIFHNVSLANAEVDVPPLTPASTNSNNSTQLNSVSSADLSLSTTATLSESSHTTVPESPPLSSTPTYTANSTSSYTVASTIPGSASNASIDNAQPSFNAPVHHHTTQHAKAANCPQLLSSHCVCGQAVYDQLEPTHTVYVTDCSNSNLTNLELLQQLPDETEVLILSHNQLTSIDGAILGQLPELSEHDSDPKAANHSNVRDHYLAVAARFANLKALDLSNNRLQRMHEQSLHALPQLRILDLTNNSLQITGTQFQPQLFKHLSLLKQLRLRNAFDQLEQHSINFVEDFTSMLIEAHLSHLTYLDLGHNRITSLPNPFAFCSLPALQKLLLNGNQLAEHFELNLNCTPYLHLLDLRENRIRRLSNATLDSLEQPGLLFHLELAGNPFWCDCTLRPTLTWLRQTKLWVVGVKQYLCQNGLSNESVEQRPLLELNPDQLLCPSASDSDDQTDHRHELHAAQRRYLAFSYTLLSSLLITAVVLISALIFVGRKRLTSRCSSLIQQIVQKRQYSPLDKQRVRRAQTDDGVETGESSLDANAVGGGEGRLTVDEDVV